MRVQGGGRREVSTDLTMLERLVEPAGKDIVDIGCGGGGLVRALARRGARVTGIEISARQLAPAVARDGGSGARYVVGSAQALPLERDSVDVAIFMRTLHHVPSPELIRALSEARRVLRRDGIVYVVEPLAEGDYFALTSLVEDEREARRAAQRAMAGAGLTGLDRAMTIEYDVRLSLTGVGALRERIVRVDPRRADAFTARQADIAAAFRRLGQPGEQPGERFFLQPMRADLLQPDSGQGSTGPARPATGSR